MKTDPCHACGAPPGAVCKKADCQQLSSAMARIEALTNVYMREDDAVPISEATKSAARRVLEEVRPLPSNITASADGELILFWGSVKGSSTYVFIHSDLILTWCVSKDGGKLRAGDEIDMGKNPSLLQLAHDVAECMDHGRSYRRFKEAVEAACAERQRLNAMGELLDQQPHPWMVNRQDQSKQRFADCVAAIAADPLGASFDITGEPAESRMARYRAMSGSPFLLTSAGFFAREALERAEDACARALGDGFCRLHNDLGCRCWQAAGPGQA